MLSSHAPHAYWLGRHWRRLLLNVTASDHAISDALNGGDAWRSVLNLTDSREAFVQLQTLPDITHLTQWMTHAKAHSGSAVEVLQALRENIRVLRAVLPNSFWHYVERSQVSLHALRHNPDPTHADSLAPLRSALQLTRSMMYALCGDLYCHVRRDGLYELIQVGAQLEHMDSVLRLSRLYLEGLMPAEFILPCSGWMPQGTDANLVLNDNTQHASQTLWQLLIHDDTLPISLRASLNGMISALQDFDLGSASGVVDELQAMLKLAPTESPSTAWIMGVQGRVTLLHYRLEQALF